LTNKHTYSVFKKEILARDATIVPIAGGNENLEIPWPSALLNNYRIIPSLVAGRKIHNDMLQFAARHSIRPTVEEFPLTEQGYLQAMERMEAGKLRYRAVLRHD
jgi:D-arabinose 1-dehydrogenase-like Zn-dependent alcohol dehydrogenase